MSTTELSYRMMQTADIDRIPMQCQGELRAVRDRIADVGTAAVLVFDGSQHVAQLQFRRYDAALRTPNGIWDPLYWGDFGDNAPVLPPESLSVFCYHVGQLDDSDERDPRYQGRGIGLAMLDFLIDWSDDAGFSYMAAKFTPEPRPVMGFMGGQPAVSYLERGFEVFDSWVDEQLFNVVREKELVPHDSDPSEVARVGCAIRKR